MDSFSSSFPSRTRSLLLALVVALAACVTTSATVNQPTALAGIAPAAVEGYLPPEAIPRSLVQVPPPPASGSAALALDEEIAQRSFALYNTPRWRQAILDADLSFPKAAGTFSCTLNIPITETDTPRLYQLLRRTLTDLGRSTSSAKNYYQRTRPFVLNQQPMCTPDFKARLENDGSYPSGHNSVGWGWALILAEISPEQVDAILVRGRNYGESRNVCNVHWHSDVMQGRLVGAGTVARLHADPVFQSDVLAAKAEVAAARRSGLKPVRDCAAEAAALAIQPSLAQ